MSLFKRINDNIRANINALLDNAEDPVKMLDQYLRDMEDDIADAEGAVAKQLALVRKLKAQLDEASGLAVKREAQAAEALRQEREDLARKALADKKLHQARANDYREQYDNSLKTAETLKIQLREMKDEYHKLSLRKDSLAARSEAARARIAARGIMDGFGKANARRGFERMEEKVLRMEAEVMAAEELGGLDRSLDEELASLESNDIDLELAELKKRISEEP